MKIHETIQFISLFQKSGRANGVAGTEAGGGTDRSALHFNRPSQACIMMKRLLPAAALSTATAATTAVALVVIIDSAARFLNLCIHFPETPDYTEAHDLP